VWRYFEAMTDDECHWEPAPDMWGVRRKSELRTALPADTSPGEWWLDGMRPAPDPTPFTTAAWRVAHLILGTWNWVRLLAQRPQGPEPSLPGDAAGLVALWKDVLDDFVDVVVGFSDEQLAEEIAVGTSRRLRSAVVSHVTLEIAFHSAEVGALRHLYRATAPDRR